MSNPTKETQPGDSKPQAQAAPTQSAFVEKAELQLKEWSARVDHLTHQAEKLTAEAKTTAHQKIGELKSKLALAREKLGVTRSAASEKWVEAKTAVETLWAETKSLFDKHDPKPS